MISKTIKYVDYNGVEKEGTYWFNMSTADLLDLEASTEGGWEETLRKLIAEQDGRKAYKFFEKFVKDAYGVKTTSGGFDKDPKHLKEFRDSAAYSSMIEDFVAHPEEAADFINGIVASVKKTVDAIDVDKAIAERAKGAEGKVMNFVTPQNP